MKLLNITTLLLLSSAVFAGDTPEAKPAMTPLTIQEERPLMVRFIAYQAAYIRRVNLLQENKLGLDADKNFAAVEKAYLDKLAELQKSHNAASNCSWDFLTEIPVSTDGKPGSGQWSCPPDKGK